jgi:hypothetical protein
VRGVGVGLGKGDDGLEELAQREPGAALVLRYAQAPEAGLLDPADDLVWRRERRLPLGCTLGDPGQQRLELVGARPDDV